LTGARVENPAFYIVSLPERRGPYEQLIKAKYPCRFFEEVRPLLAACFEAPPLAVLIDVPSAVRLGRTQLAPLFGLKVSWPVIRCTFRGPGNATAMCDEPPQNAPLASALEAIHKGDKQWATRFFRKHVRVELQARVRFRESPEGPWKLGNCINLGNEGLFMICYDAPPLTSRLELELLDILEGPQQIIGITAWVRSWDESPELPGVGVELEGGPDLARVRSAMLEFFMNQVAKRV
jgi:hypothetical protein